MRRGFPFVAICLGVALSNPLAHADPVPSLDLRNFHPPTDPEGTLYLEPVHTPGPWAWNVGAWLSYGWRPVVLVLNGARDGSVIEHQLSLDYLASVGIGSRLALGVTLPTVLYQTGDDVSTLIGAARLPSTALGDPALVSKVTLMPPGALGGFGLAAIGRLTAPAGNRSSYVSEAAASGEVRLLGELNLVLLAVRMTAGALVRGREQAFVGERFGHNLPWGVGVHLRPQGLGLDDRGRWLWSVEFRGNLALSPKFAAASQSPAFAGLSARYKLGSVSLLAGAELPLNGATGVPLVRGVIGLGWAPRFYDQDSDGIEDDYDDCPELAEDRDGFEDRDGCPELDNDGDGVADDRDRCPTALEDEDGFQDDDGCPDPDNDRDGVPDGSDACPLQAGPATQNPRFNGCPPTDRDGDGITDAQDRCITVAEDLDGFEDQDGCPDPDNDRDGVIDQEDACPNTRGRPRSDPKLNGCPSPDQDGDTFDDTEDKCPDRAEDFNGKDDNDGCPDEDAEKPPNLRAKPLVEYQSDERRQWLRMRTPIRFTVTQASVEINPVSIPVVRAIARELNRDERRVLMVGVRPSADTQPAEQLALDQAFALVRALSLFLHRDESAETVAWSVVSDLPGAQAAGMGLLLLGPPSAPAVTPKR